MCGIAGYFGPKLLSDEACHKTLELMKNRGPDFQDFKKVEGKSNNAFLLFSRLSIIDLDPRSNQPFTYEGHTLIFNGELYNYREIRDELEVFGHRFKTESDTEVLLRSYLHWGEECLERFEGMWSFAIYNQKDGSLFLARDRFGEKPFYIAETESGIFFASEIKFIKSLAERSFEVNKDQIASYLVNGYKSLFKFPRSFFQGIRPLGQGVKLKYFPDLTSEEKVYWRPSYKPQKMSEHEAVQGIRERLFRSVELRLRSDVPLAFCLSGGIDSAGLASIAAKEFGHDVTTFSIIDSDERYNEEGNIDQVVQDLGCKSHKLNLSFEGGQKRLEDLIAYHDSPIVTISYFVHSLLSESIAERGFKVAISGTSADELFTGYYDHFLLHLAEVANGPHASERLLDWKKWQLPNIRNPLLQDPQLYLKNPENRDHIYMGREDFLKFLKVPFLEDFTEVKYTESLLRNRMLNELMHEVTPAVLHDDDLNSMFNSIENRSPYLDSELFNFAYSIPSDLLIKDGFGKHLLREALKGVLVDSVRLDRRKKGFNASLNSLFDFSDKATREWVLDDGPAYDLVDKSKIESLLKEKTLPNSQGKFLFNFINTKIFLEQNLLN